jgi:hypothetical protein
MRVKPEIVPVFKIQLYLTHESLNLVLESLNLVRVGALARRAALRSWCDLNKQGVLFSTYIQGRILTLPRFFDSDQKQIENIYRYQI